MLLRLKLKNLLLLLGCGLFLATDTQKSLAQIVPDGSTPTTVTTEGNNNVVRDGLVSGENLFHSFSDFSLPDGGEVSFDNAATIDNIISRVTGGKVSDLNGIIRANGSANLFLINPAGIIFREGASLQIGGSFLGSTADSIIFPDDIEFSADAAIAPLLTVNAPIGLSFRNDPAAIEVRGANLRVAPDRSLSLIGGEINFTGGLAIARDGLITLGGLSEAGIVDLDENLGANFGSDLAEANLSFSDGAQLEVSGTGAGAIALTGSNITLADNSVFNAGLDVEQTATAATPGNITLAATAGISLGDNSIIRNNVGTDSTGDTGGISLEASNISLQGDSRISSTVNGNGNTRGIIVNASNSLNLEDSQINSRVAVAGVGNSGELQIEATNLNLLNSSIFAQTLGNGSPGNLSVNVAENINLVNGQFQSQVVQGGRGNGGNITIDTGNLSLDNGRVLADSNGFGDAGNVFITATGDVSLDNDTIILSKVSEAEGNAGNVNINSDRLLLDGRSFIISNTGDRDFSLTNIGDAGDVNVNARIVLLDNFSLITSNALNNADGQPGNVELQTDSLTIAGGSNINALTENNFAGGAVTVEAGKIDLNTGGKIVTGTSGAGNGGSINLNVAEEIAIDGEDAPTQSEPFIEQILQDLEPETGLFANSTANATGDGGNINISNSQVINLTNGATISVKSEGTGNGGNLSLTTQNLTLDNEGVVEAFTVNGTGGNVELRVAEIIFLKNNSNSISARAFNDADGGNLNIETNFIVALPNQNNDIVANADTGNGGNIDISAESLLGLEERASQPANSTNDIDASSQFGLDGSVSISTPDVDRTKGGAELDTKVIEPQANVSQVCSAEDSNTAGSLSIRGKGGIPSMPTEPFIADTIIAPANVQTNVPTKPQSSGILTASGYIHPARGVIVREDGKVILHRSRNTQSASRNILKSRNCS